MSSLETTRALFGATRSPFLEGIRYLLAWSLMGASEVLTRVAVRLLAAPSGTSQRLSQLEFHVDAGHSAARGAIYVDGEWVAWLPGVSRL